MASLEWLQVYRNYTDTELNEEIAWLKTQVRNPFGSQTEGNRSYNRSTAEFRDRLDAAFEVKKERGNSGQEPRHIIADFSGVTQGGNYNW